MKILQKEPKKIIRFNTRVVKVGDIGLGGSNPIRIQSMTTTDTLDVNSTVKQSIEIINAGSDYVRITAPSIKAVSSLKIIKNKLIKNGYNTPLIADIHFTPNAAIEAAKVVDKVRINPGNYADSKKFKTFDYTDNEYNDELDRIYKRFSPLVDVCKIHGTAMRIGVNHGSLSDRILNRYGDTPKGMVESAMEFIRICEDRNYFNIVLSMKSSNPIVMVHAYRMLVNCMIDENMNYPLHLGVTEAGEGLDGRVKSSVGIGSLLDDGIGDTIRVSLTESPEKEIPVAKMILNNFKYRNYDEKNKKINNFPLISYKKRFTSSVDVFGGENVPRVIVDARNININYSFLSAIGYEYISKDDKWHIKDMSADCIIIGEQELKDINFPYQLTVISSYDKYESNKSNNILLMNLDDYKSNNKDCSKILNLKSNYKMTPNLKNRLLNDKKTIIMLEIHNDYSVLDCKDFINSLSNNKINLPVIIYSENSKPNFKQWQIDSSIEIGTLLVDGLIDGFLISNLSNCDISKEIKLSFKILQATRSRITQTEFISCPSCGRTQFDLIETTALVRSKTSHLKGLKIAIMGCIVNGPGEMADADYGYVGTGIGLVSLYKGHSIVKKNLLKEEALIELVNLIKENGDWVEPSTNL